MSRQHGITITRCSQSAALRVRRDTINIFASYAISDGWIVKLT